MTLVSKSKSKGKEKLITSPIKEQQNGGTPAKAYNPILGTFHAIDASYNYSLPDFRDNSHFQNIKGMAVQPSSPLDTLTEFDSVSNNVSSSSQSKDLKEKTSIKPLSAADSEKRKKICLQNEKKHQRQREKRAQELYEHCCSYLMSRKLDVLSRQLMAMGISHERATSALIVNEGRLEESVSWLFEGNEEASDQDTLHDNLKIDITEELTKISEIEVRYKCTKQEVERAIVTCRGDLEKAEKTLRVQKLEIPTSVPEPMETSNMKNLMRHQEKSAGLVTIQQSRKEQDINYSATASAIIGSKPRFRNTWVPTRNQQKPLAEKTVVIGSSASVPSAVAPLPHVAAPTNVAVQQDIVGNRGKIIQQEAIRGPVILMQNPQALHAKQNLVSGKSTSPLVTGRWFAKGVPVAENIGSDGRLLSNQSTEYLGSDNQSSEQFYHQAPSNQMSFMYNPINSSSARPGIPLRSTTLRRPSLAFQAEPQHSLALPVQSSRGPSLPTLSVQPPRGPSLPVLPVQSSRAPSLLSLLVQPPHAPSLPPLPVQPPRSPSLPPLPVQPPPGPSLPSMPVHSSRGLSLPTSSVQSSRGPFATGGSVKTVGSSTDVNWNNFGGNVMPQFNYKHIDWTLHPNLASSFSRGQPKRVSSLPRSSNNMRMIDNMGGSFTYGLWDVEPTPPAMPRE